MMRSIVLSLLLIICSSGVAFDQSGKANEGKSDQILLSTLEKIVTKCSRTC